MGLQPKIQRTATFTVKRCAICGQTFGADSFAPCKSIFFADHTVPMCNDCADRFLRDPNTGEVNWDRMNKLCQMCDIPFVPKELVRLQAMGEDNLFYRYACLFESAEYDGLHWQDYNDAYEKLRAAGKLQQEVPLVSDEARRKLRARWGGNYDDEALNYLENLFNGLLATQNVNGSLQADQALKLCKMSYEIDRRIAAGEDFDKLLSSYDKMVKTAEFTPKNAKNLNDFDSVGEVIKWMEKKGWKNKFYDGVTRDVVDETIKNFQSFNQRLYTHETNIADQIEQRLHNLESAVQMENYYNTGSVAAGDDFDTVGYQQLFQNEDDETFDVSLEDKPDAFDED